MNVLSLFDGISCGQEALKRAGIKVDKYYASEIDEYAISIAQKNFPNTIQLGDVAQIQTDKLPKIDLLIGGSPCQGFSFAGKQLNFSDPRSSLFFEYVRILNQVKPTYFLLENVKMKKEYRDIISKCLGVEPIEINSALVSAQNRKRLYWTNIPGIMPPEDKGIMLKDIVHENVDVDVSTISKNGKAHALTASYNGAVAWNSYERKQRTMLFETLAEYIVPFDKTLQILNKEVERGKVGYFRKDSQANRVYYIHGKAVTLCGDAGGGGGAAKMGQYLFGHTKSNQQGNRVYCEDEKGCTLNASSGGIAGKGNLLLGVVNRARGNNTGGLRNNGTKSPTLSSNSWEHNNHLMFGCITPDRVNKRQNGQRFSNGNKFYTLTAQDRHGVLVEGYIRKLTPIECERLQTLPDNYTEGISKSQRYKCLGNGWTVDVIVHILNSLKEVYINETVQ